MDGQFLPKIEVRQSDRDANPAINPEDWEVIINHVRNKWRKEAYEPFVEYALDVHYNGVVSMTIRQKKRREESFERRWNRARVILLKSK